MSKRRLCGVLSVVLAACGSPETVPSAEQEIRSTSAAQQSLYGTVKYDDARGTCSPEVKKFLKTIMYYGRVAAQTDVFTGCVSREISANYLPCKGQEPFSADTVAIQTAQALTVTRSILDVKFACLPFNNALAKASDGVARGEPDERMDLGVWFQNQALIQKKPLCGSVPDSSCREISGMAWPARQGANAVWHEVMHNYGYDHDNGDGSWCGYQPKDNYNMFVNSMPYIIGECIDQALQFSNLACNNIENEFCGPGQLYVLNGGSCKCVADTKAHPPALSLGECRAAVDCDKNITITCQPTVTNLEYVFEELQANGVYKEVGRSLPTEYLSGSPTYRSTYTLADRGGSRLYRVCRENENGKYCNHFVSASIPSYEKCFFPRPLRSGECTGFGECGKKISLWCEKPSADDNRPAYIFEQRQPDGKFSEIGRSVYPYYDLGYGLGRIPEVFFSAPEGDTNYTFRVCRENAYGITCAAPFDVKSSAVACTPPPPPSPCVKCFKLPSGGRICCDACIMPTCKAPAGSVLEASEP